MPLHRQQIVDKQAALTQQNKKRIKEAALPSSIILSYPLQDSTSPALHRLALKKLPRHLPNLPQTYLSLFCLAF